MKNIITASIEFYFKGEKFQPSITIDLNDKLQASDYFPDICALIATANNIDHYSYEYEMMQAATIKFTAVEGLVSRFIENGVLNTADFINAWQDSNAQDKLLSIAQQHMDINDLSQHPELNAALIAAYNLGKQTDHR